MREGQSFVHAPVYIINCSHKYEHKAYAGTCIVIFVFTKITQVFIQVATKPKPTGNGVASHYCPIPEKQISLILRTCSDSCFLLFQMLPLGIFVSNGFHLGVNFWLRACVAGTNPDEHALLCRLFAHEVTNFHMRASENYRVRGIRREED